LFDWYSFPSAFSVWLILSIWFFSLIASLNWIFWLIVSFFLFGFF
jgi:hypothetical protein